LAEEAEPHLISSPHLTGREQWPWRARLAAELDNLRATLHWFLERAAADECLRLALVLESFWGTREGYTEAWAGLEQALALPSAATRPRVRALVRFGWVSVARGNTSIARHLLAEAFTLGRELDDRVSMARSLVGLGMLALHQRDYPQAHTVLEESLVACRAASDWWGLANALCTLAGVVNLEGNHALARTLLDEALALAHTTGEHQIVADVLEVRGEVAFAVGDYAEAGRLWEESVNRYHQLGLTLGSSEVESCLGHLNLRLGDFAAARAHFRSGLDQQRGWLYWAMRPLAGLAAVAAARGQAERALCLAAAVSALGDVAALRLPVPEQEALERASATARAALDERTAAAVWAAGRAMTLAGAIAEARGVES
jgi:tetratricopeptide (TPR) repeat protein